MNLVLLRHAESKGNADGNYSTVHHDSLSALGREQATGIVDCLREFDFDEVVVSPLQRALETVAPYLDATGKRAEIWPEIAEACWQEEVEPPSESWDTQPVSVPDEIAGLFHFRNGEAVKPAAPGSFAEGMCRAKITYERILEMTSTPVRSVLMVTHGHFVRELMNLILDTRKRARFSQVNCALTSLTFDGVWQVQFCNRPAHTGTPGGSDRQGAGA